MHHRLSGSVQSVVVREQRLVEGVPLKRLEGGVHVVAFERQFLYRGTARSATAANESKALHLSRGERCEPARDRRKLDLHKNFR